MDFVKREIIDGETVINKDLLECMEDGIIEGITKAEKSAGRTDGIGEIFNDYENNVATGAYSHAANFNTSATGEAADATGRKTQAKGKGSHAGGGSCVSDGDYAFSDCYYNRAEGPRSFSVGDQNESKGFASHSQNYKTKAYGKASTTKGAQTQAGKLDENGNPDENYGYAASAEGESTLALGHRTHSEGNDTKALGDNSHSEGEHVEATGRSQHVQGRFGIADDTVTEDNPYGTYAHIVGGGTDAYKGRKNIHTLDWEGNARYSGDVYVGADLDGSGGQEVATKKYVDDNKGYTLDKSGRVIFSDYVFVAGKYSTGGLELSTKDYVNRQVNNKIDLIEKRVDETITITQDNYLTYFNIVDDALLELKPEHRTSGKLFRMSADAAAEVPGTVSIREPQTVRYLIDGNNFAVQINPTKIVPIVLGDAASPGSWTLSEYVLFESNNALLYIDVKGNVAYLASDYEV